MTQTHHSLINSELTFYCFQPLSYEGNHWKDVLSSNTHLKKIEKYTSNISPSWFDDLNTDGVFDFTHIIKLKSISSDLLKLDLQNHDLITQYLDLEKTKYYLILDSRFMYFTLVYEISLSLPHLKINDLLQSTTKGLYNTIRGALNKNTDSSQIGTWALNVRQEAKNRADKVVKSTLNYKFKKKGAVFIENNTCNITCLVNIDDSLQEGLIKEISEQIIEHNCKSELKNTNQDTIPLANEGSFLYFNGRFHTIFSYQISNSYQYISIQYHAQYMWFFLLKINSLLAKINFDISTNFSNNHIKTMNLLDALISKIELLNIYNERYKSALEKNIYIYEKTEKTWSIERLLTTSNRYIKNFSDHIERLAFKGITKKQNRQNSLLLILSITQFLALISVWNDYITINNLPINQLIKFQDLFGGVKNIQKFNFHLPVVLIITISCFTLVFFNLRHFVNFIKERFNKQ